jgi:hypothetical protein
LSVEAGALPIKIAVAIVAIIAVVRMVLSGA